MMVVGIHTPPPEATTRARVWCGLQSDLRQTILLRFSKSGRIILVYLESCFPAVTNARCTSVLGYASRC